MDKLNGKELGEAFGDAVNNFNFDSDEFVKSYLKQHRTLQQSMISAMISCIEATASDEYNFDGRNEGAHKTCKEMIKGWKAERVKSLVESDIDGYWTEDRLDDYINNPQVKPSKLPFI